MRYSVLVRQAYTSFTSDSRCVYCADAKKPPQNRHRLQNSLKVSCFFFQAEDGIRDRDVTGVQTCALPILRILRKTIADQEEVPPYVIFHDTSLKEMSIYYPQSLQDFRKISGGGEQKLRKYGEIFLKEIGDYCKQYNVQSNTISHKDPEPRLKQPKTLT